MGTFNAKILAEFQPPRKWKLGRELSYSTTDLDSDDIAALQDIGLDLKRDTNISPAVFTVPTEFMTDLASTPRALWAFVAPFDVAEQRLFTTFVQSNQTIQMAKRHTRRRQRINQESKSSR